MAKKRKVNNIYEATGINGETFVINAPNAETARIVALNSETPIVSCQRVFKNGKFVGKEIMKKSDIFSKWS